MGGTNLSLRIRIRRDSLADWLLFLAGGLFVGDGLALLLVGAAGLAVFLRGLLLVGLRGSIAHGFIFSSAD